MADIKVGNNIYTGVDSIKMDTPDGGTVTFSIGGGASEEGAARLLAEHDANENAHSDLFYINIAKALTEAKAYTDKIAEESGLEVLPDSVRALAEELALRPSGNMIIGNGIESIQIGADGMLEYSKDGNSYSAFSGGGHAIFDSQGRRMVQRARLQFRNVNVTDDGRTTIIDYGSKYDTQDVVLMTGNWVGSEAPWGMTVSLDGLTETDLVELVPTPGITVEQLDALQKANIIGGSQTAGTITIMAYGKLPGMDLPARFIIRRYE